MMWNKWCEIYFNLRYGMIRNIKDVRGRGIKIRGKEKPRGDLRT